MYFGFNLGGAINKRNLIREINRRTRISEGEVDKILYAFIRTIEKTLIKREKVNLRDFGVFKLYFRKEFSSALPNGQETNISGQHIVKFIPGRELRAKIDPSFPRAIKPKKKSLFGFLGLGFKKPKPEPPDAQRGSGLRHPAERDRRSKPEPPKIEVPLEKIKHQDEEVKVETPPTEAPKPEPKPKHRAKIIDLKNKKISKKVLAMVPEYIARLYKAVPIEIKGGTLIIAMENPNDLQAAEFIKKKIGRDIEVIGATEEDIKSVLDRYSGIEGEIEEALAGSQFVKKIKAKKKGKEGELISEEAPTSKIVNSLLTQAARLRASDIHIEPKEFDVGIRFRIDGVLQNVTTLPKSIQDAVTTKVKILSRLKIDETRLPQDGRFKTGIDEKEIDLRVSTFPTIYGEKIVLRLLDKGKGILTLEELGLRGTGFKIVENNIHKSHGMTLVTGPTGSGKTTTLYAIIDRLNNAGLNIITLEDPVEYQIEGVNQGQINPKIGFGFASGLRSILRQDPDVVMVGEIRDFETAEMGVQAALTGHIVLSTLHTNDAAGAIPRLIDMKVEPFLLISSVNTIIAQRLVRKICENCLEEDTVSEMIRKEIEEELEALPEKEKGKVETKNLKFYKGKGCEVCNSTGYKGRIGLFEVLGMSPAIQEITIRKSGSAEIETQAKKDGMLTLKQDGILKAIDKLTSIEEIWRVTKD